MPFLNWPSFQYNRVKAKQEMRSYDCQLSNIIKIRLLHLLPHVFHVILYFPLQNQIIFANFTVCHMLFWVVAPSPSASSLSVPLIFYLFWLFLSFTSPSLCFPIRYSGIDTAKTLRKKWEFSSRAKPFHLFLLLYSSSILRYSWPNR
jgi:hypothetical protein